MDPVELNLLQDAAEVGVDVGGLAQGLLDAVDAFGDPALALVEGDFVVERSLPIAAVSEVNRSPVSCIPSPESPAKRMTTRSSFWTVLLDMNT